MMKMIRPVLISLLTAWAGLAADPASDLLKAKPDAVEAWKDMRFGMFICWGPVSLTGKEIGWSRGNPTPVEEYDTLYQKWNPDKFDAREWAKVVKQTGCRYVVFLDGCRVATRPADFFAGQADRSPANEHPKPHVLPRLDRVGLGFKHLAGWISCQTGATRQQNDEHGSDRFHHFHFSNRAR